MNPLLKAIYTKAISAGSFNTAIGGKFYLGLAPDNTSGTYCVLYPITDAKDLWFNRRSFQDYEVQFSLFDDTPKSADTITTVYGYLTTLFDEVILSVTGWTFKQMLRGLVTGPDWFPDDRLWQMTVSYHVKLEK